MRTMRCRHRGARLVNNEDLGNRIASGITTARRRRRRIIAMKGSCMPDRNASSLESCVVSPDELVLVTGGARANEWDDYAASLKRELQPQLNHPTPQVKAAVCGVVGF